MVRHSLRFLAALALCAGVARADGSLRCGGRLVSVGDARIDLLGRCGEPALRDRRLDERWEGVTDGTKGQGRRTTTVIEEWTYDFGPFKLTRIATLKNGTLADIRTGGYGYGGSAKPAAQECSEQSVSVGERTSDVLAKCGEPAWKDTRQEEISQRLQTGQVQKTLITIEEWTYDLGPTRFVRIFTFRNGTLSDIRTGGYGYELRQEEKKKAP